MTHHVQHAAKLGEVPSNKEHIMLCPDTAFCFTIATVSLHLVSEPDSLQKEEGEFLVQFHSDLQQFAAIWQSTEFQNICHCGTSLAKYGGEMEG